MPSVSLQAYDRQATEGSPSIACLFLRPDGQQADLVFINSVENNITALTELDEPFPVFFFHVFRVTADMRLLSQDLNSGADGVDGARRSIGIFRR